MAVPPAPDSSVVIGKPARRGISTLTILSVAFVVVLTGCLGVLVFRYVNDTQGSSVGDRVGQLFGAGAGAGAASDDSAGREDVMKQADQFMLRINTYGPGDLDKQNSMPAYADSVHEVITPKLAVSFDQNVTLAAQSVAQAGYARSVDLFSTGVQTIDADSATVLVAGALNGSYPDPRRKQGRIEYEPQPFRVAVALVKVSGTWLVDDFTPVTDGTEDPAQPPSAATPPAAPTPTKEPTTAPTTKPTKPAPGSGTNGAKP